MQRSNTDATVISQNSREKKNENSVDILFYSVLIFLRCDRYENSVSCFINTIRQTYCWNFKHNGSESLRISLKIWNIANDPKI